MPYKDRERLRQYHRERRLRMKTRVAQTVPGLAQNANPDILTVEDIRGVLARLVIELQAAKKMDLVSRARCIGSLCNVLLTCMTEGDFEKRLTAVESKLEGNEHANEKLEA